MFVGAQEIVFFSLEDCFHFCIRHRFFTHFTAGFVAAFLIILSHHRAFFATTGAICLQSVHICIPTKKKDPYRFSVRVFLLLLLEFPNLNIQIPGFCCIADDVQNRVPVASGKAAA